MQMNEERAGIESFYRNRMKKAWGMIGNDPCKRGKLNRIQYFIRTFIDWMRNKKGE